MLNNYMILNIIAAGLMLLVIFIGDLRFMASGKRLLIAAGLAALATIVVLMRTGIFLLIVR